MAYTPTTLELSRTVKTGPIKKVLVANRAEIAVRVMRTCREMGIQSVAVFSDVDRSALHTRYATEAYHIGPPAPRESYLHMQKLIDAAKQSGADAIHPGYGFLSENAEFAQRVMNAGLIFIGPPPYATELMGPKTTARQVMSKAGVPIVPGLEEPVADEGEALAYAKKIGFPVMLKAAAGGGGKGMRKIDREQDFASAWRSARSEAKNSFGDDAVYLEKFLVKPRHIEIQVFADTHGNVHYLFERECSVQRRHQKLIEEAPSPFVAPEMRKQMGEVACNAARAVGYVGAGTVEMLVDANRNFYFMEMNTRLQVEHPVTEMVTGFDLVEAQIRVARGEPLPWGHQPESPRGWAMEARVCAEDATANFVPVPGRINHLRTPGGPYVRTDTGIYPGFTITTDYDPMIAKVIAWGRDRNTARLRLDRALAEFTLKGTTTNTAFLREILAFEEFASGSYDTGIIERFQQSPSTWVTDEHKVIAMLAAAFFRYEEEQEAHTRVVVGRGTGKTGKHVNAWKRGIPPKSANRW
ncbi:MAG: pyruvate carboxylase subunit A [Deltaproteobacteria bacterium RBG_16_71_12]|nr:MAG: pyruvate carboxylase subunit A [Deltaproteobacteria bacterium RBG_16_71_12]